MKWMVMMLAAALVSGATLGCDASDETNVDPAAPTTNEVTPDMEMADPAVDPATTIPTTQASAARVASNQYCAVMGEHKIDPEVTVAHAGKTIGFCCEDCIPKFKEEPAKYLATLK